jgi:hypothetical protein
LQPEGGETRHCWIFRTFKVDSQNCGLPRDAGQRRHRECSNLNPRVGKLTDSGSQWPSEADGVVLCAGPEICKWVLEQHDDAMELETEMNAKRWAAIGDGKLLHDF